MKEICKNSEISSFLDAAWHDTIKETPNKDGYARKHESPNSASVLEKAKSIFNVLL